MKIQGLIFHFKKTVKKKKSAGASSVSQHIHMGFETSQISHKGPVKIPSPM